MGNASVKGHEVDDHGPTLVARHLTSYTNDSDTEGKVSFIPVVLSENLSYIAVLKYKAILQKKFSVSG